MKLYKIDAIGEIGSSDFNTAIVSAEDELHAERLVRCDNIIRQYCPGVQKVKLRVTEIHDEKKIITWNSGHLEFIFNRD